jgi:AraC-like DNA-binding protein
MEYFNSSVIPNSNLDFYQWYIHNDKILNTDLNFYTCGGQKCENGHFFGPAVREYYLVHCIVSGKGTFRCGKKTYDLGPGDGFLICPQDVTYYEADKEDPWHYVWVGFNGINAQELLNQCGLSYDNPIFYYNNNNAFADIISALENANKFSFQNDLIRMGYLYLFISILTEVTPYSGQNYYSHSITEEYVKSAIDYIERNYHCDISVNSLSEYIGISRKYLCTIFKKFLGQTPIEFILNTRMRKACSLLINDHLTVSEVSNSIGYKDQFIFSKQFKNIIGESPSKYRQNHMN